MIEPHPNYGYLLAVTVADHDNWETQATEIQRYIVTIAATLNPKPEFRRIEVKTDDGLTIFFYTFSADLRDKFQRALSNYKGAHG